MRGLLDTNVISELMRPAPSRSVLDWLDASEPGDLFVCAVTIGELTYGIGVLPDGKRKRRLEKSLRQAMTEAFSGRILPYDQPAGDAYGRIMSHRRALGLPMSIPDGQIAAIATVNRLGLVTRNVRDFDELNLNLHNPF